MPFVFEPITTPPDVYFTVIRRTELASVYINRHLEVWLRHRASWSGSNEHTVRFPAVGVLSRVSLFFIGHSRQLVGHAVYRSRLIPAHLFRIRSLSAPRSLDAK